MSPDNTSDAVVDAAEYQEDTFTLAGIEFIAAGPIRVGSISEFSTGLKIGEATYDEREHASWLVLSDFSGGFGHRRLRIREAGGTHFDNIGGVDLRQPRLVTLPGQRVQSAPTSNLNPTDIVTTSTPFHPTLMFSSLGSSFLHMGIGDALYTLETDGTFTRRNVHVTGAANRIISLIDFRGSDGTRRLYAGYGDQGDYLFSTNGTSWDVSSNLPSIGTERNMHAAIVWDGQIIAQAINDGGITSSADGVTWAIDDSTIGEAWRPTGNINWAGVAQAPWGASAPYFIDQFGGGLWALDLYSHNATKIEGLGDTNNLRRATVWNGSVYVTDSRTIWEYNPSGGTIRSIGPFGPEGVPTSWVDGEYRIVQLIPGAKDLFALCYSGDIGVVSTAAYRVAVYNVAGWSWWGPEITGIPWGAIIGTLSAGSSGAALDRSLHIIDRDTSSTVVVRRHQFQLPEFGDTQYVGSDRLFENGPLSFETGWFDGGFADLDGALIRMNFDGYNMTANETVRVEYRLNNNEDATYIDLGTFTENQQVVWFTPEDKRGVEFKSVQFRVTLNRDTSDASKSPELHALILLYDKKPLFRTSWTVRVDVNRMVERQIQIGGEKATLETIWQTLKTLSNDPRLLTLKVPSIEPGGVNVRITDMPALIDDFRESVRGKGSIELQMIETISQ